MASNSKKLHQEGVKLFRGGKYEAARQKLEEALQNETDPQTVSANEGMAP